MDCMYSADDYRRVKPIDQSDGFRSPFRRDYARLIHSPAFRRLQGKTQLYPSHESDFFRNRLTHSLEVAQIAKGITQKLNYENEFLRDKNEINLDLVEFAALAHDLGHPPFGHNGEKALDDCMKSWGGFEGNAQTLRIVAVTEKKEALNDSYLPLSSEGEDQRLGLNLAYRSLASILKYDRQIPPCRRAAEGLVKGYYHSESTLVSDIRKSVAPGIANNQQLKTIECQIMDLADDIAYSTYDLEDGLKGGFVDPLMLLHTIQTNVDVVNEVVKKVQRECPGATTEDVVNALTQLLEADDKINNNEAKPLGAYSWSREVATNGYVRIAFTSALVDKFIRGATIRINEEHPALSILDLPNDLRLQIEVLKHLNFQVTIMSSRLKLVEYRGYEVVETLFQALADEENGGHLLLPADVRDTHSKLKEEDARKRVICDFIAGMTDRYAVEFFGRIKHGEQSIFKPF